MWYVNDYFNWCYVHLRSILLFCKRRSADKNFNNPIFCVSAYHCDSGWTSSRTRNLFLISTNRTSSIPACQWLLKRSWIAAQHPNSSWARTRRQINCCSPKTFHDTGSGCRAFIKASTRCSRWRTRRSRRSWRSCLWWVLLCKAKRQYLLTLQVSRYCLLALHGGVVVYRLTSILVINSNNTEIFFV